MRSSDDILMTLKSSFTACGIGPYKRHEACKSRQVSRSGRQSPPTYPLQRRRPITGSASTHPSQRCSSITSPAISNCGELYKVSTCLQNEKVVVNVRSCLPFYSSCLRIGTRCITSNIRARILPRHHFEA